MNFKKEKIEALIKENKEVFYEELQKVVKPLFKGLERPELYRDTIKTTLEISSRKSIPRQAQVVAAATEYLSKRKNRSLIISAEMGTGKTDKATKISIAMTVRKIKSGFDLRCPVYFVVCPPHLVDTWKEEIAINYKDSSRYKAIRIKRWEDLAPYAKRRLWDDGIVYYFIVTRENLKLSYPKDAAVQIKTKNIVKEIESEDGETEHISKTVKVAVCPDCGSTLKEGSEFGVNLQSIPRKCEECGSVLRRPSSSCSKKMRTRESIADFIFKRFKKGSYNVILDEMHEYKGGDTGQGNAMGRLVSHARKTIGLTGTLMNGYASSLFYLLYRLNPRLMKQKLGFDYNQVQDFVKIYGAHEEIIQAKESDIEGKVTKMGKRIALKERPKISPFILSVLLEMTIFLRLDEMKLENDSKLPPYEEIIDLVDMEEELYGPYMSYIEDLVSLVKKDKTVLGRLAVDAIAIPDMPFTYRETIDGNAKYEPPCERESFGLTNKEKRLIENIRGEIEQDRKCLVYITFSNQQVATDLQNILTEAFPEKTIKFLPSSVAADKRKEWIKKNPCDVLIANPELVKTGLTLLEFVTIIFYETTYNVFTLKQASRRSWRIGQTKDIKVIFMAYKDTPQHKALELIGAKIAAANSLEGRLSGGDDLSSMGDDESSIQVALAKSILKGESATSDIKTTSLKSFGEEREFNRFERFYLNVAKEYEENEVNKKEDIVDIKETLEEHFGIKDIPNIQICSLPEEKKKITKEEMVQKFAKELQKHHDSGDLYGGILNERFGSYSMQMAYPLFEIDNDYREGKYDGMAVSYRRDEKNFVTHIEVRSVYINDKIPFETRKILASINLETIKPFLEAKDEGMLVKKLGDLINEKQQTVSFVAVVGKGRKEKQVKIEQANNLFEVAFKANGSTGVQLAFDF